MWYSYLKIAYRNILNNKGYSLINLFGLAVGIASSLMMFNYVKFESSYDNFHPYTERTYRVDRDLDNGPSSSTAPPMAYTLMTNFAEVEETTRINTPGDFIIRYTDENEKVYSFMEDQVFAADSNFFSFFGFQLKEGNPETALRGANKVILSAPVAQKIFGNKSALGKMLMLGEERTLIEVTGVTQAQPENSHFHFDYLLSMDTNPNVRYRDWSWVWTQVVTYVRLKPEATPAPFNDKMAALAEKVIRPSMEARGMNYQNTLQGKGLWNFYLTPIRDIHLKSGDNRIGPVGDIKYIYTFGIIGGFVLLIATINFINLSTARATKRAKEVGVKKAMGAHRISLMAQFQFEALIMTTISMIFAMVVLESLELIVANLIGITIPFNLFSDLATWWVFPTLPVVIGLLAGSYPSFYLTTFKPIQVLKGKLVTRMGRSSLRNVMVITQFAISIALITGTIIVFSQLWHLNTTNLGFNRENVLLIRHAEKLGNHLESFRAETEQFPGVMDAGVAMEVPGGGVWSDEFVREGSEAFANIAIVKADDHYLKSLDFTLLAGRMFDRARPSDKEAVIPNEMTVRQMGWTPEEAIGQYIVYPGGGNTRHEIIGVMKDFNYQSLRESIIPLMFCNVEASIWGDWRLMTVKYESLNLRQLIQHINKRWNAVLNDTPFEYSFLDEELSMQYRNEQQLGRLFGTFSGLAIFIAIIGLVGLVSYSAEVRRKEIGVRKVFGASSWRILLMMNSEYLKLIFIGLLISIPFTWWIFDSWLEEFIHRIKISPLIFLLAGLAQVVVALLCVGYLSMRASLTNPAEVLREE